MTTLATMIAEVRARLDEASPAFWSDEEITRWINEGTRDIARRAEVLETSATVSVVAGTAEYTLAANVARINRVAYIPTGSSQQYPLEYKDFNSMDAAGWTWTTARGYPVVYTLWGYTPNLKAVLYPTPAAAGTLKYWYYAYPTELATDGSAAGSTVDVPNGWDDLVITYCEAMALRKDANPRWEEARQLYEGNLLEMMDRSRRWTDQGDAIQQNGHWLPGWLWNPDY